MRQKKCQICKNWGATKQVGRMTTRSYPPNKYGQQAVVVYNKQIMICEECYRKELGGSK